MQYLAHTRYHIVDVRTLDLGAKMLGVQTAEQDIETRRYNYLHDMSSGKLARSNTPCAGGMKTLYKSGKAKPWRFNPEYRADKH